MSLACPACGQSIRVRDATKPGRFRMNCPACDRALAILVGDPPDFAMSVRPIEASPEPPTSDLGPTLTGPALWDQLRRFVAERAGWIWRAITHRQSLVGGAVILEEWGRTSRGTIGRGRHLLLGRDVLIRLLSSDWGSPDVVSLARANREAYVASEIIHPNLIRQIDSGQDRSRRYVIDESIESPILTSLTLGADWKGGAAALPVILHVGRALLAAHDQGLAHGDPSPENIGIDASGVIKLMGLGLGDSQPDSQAPFALSAALDAQKLGFTLEALAFRGNRNGKSGSDLAQSVADKLKAVGTPEGYHDLPDAVRAIETLLGLTPGGSFLPRDDEAKRLEDAVERFHNSPFASLRVKLVLGFVGVCSLFFLLFLKTGHLALAGGVLGLLGMTTLIYTLTRAGVSRRSGLLGRVRELVLGGRRSDWLAIGAILAIGLVALFYLGWLTGWVALFIVSAGLAVGFVMAIDVPILQDREGPLNDARSLLGTMRSRGVSEMSLREFACKFGGPRWEELFEALFGLDETRRALTHWAHSNPGRFRWDAWRFPLIDWVDARLRDRREMRARTRFERLEEAAAIARKVNDMTARRKSQRIAEALIVVGREVRQTSLNSLAPPDSKIAVRPRPITDLLREAVESPDKLLTSTYSDHREAGPNPILQFLSRLLGSRTRFCVGVLLLAAFVLWADQVKVASLSEIRASAEQALNERDIARFQTVNLDLAQAANAKMPLELPGIPAHLTRSIVGYGVGTAGLILIVSAFIQGQWISVFAVVGALIAWVGPLWGIPAVAPMSPTALSSTLGAGILGLGALVARRSVRQ